MPVRSGPATRTMEAMDMTRTFDAGAAPAQRRTSWRERLFVLGGFALAALWTAGSLALGAGWETIGPAWMAAVAWTAAAAAAHALWLGIRRRDWSSFRRYRLPGGRDEDFDWSTRTGAYAYLRIQEEHERLMRGD